MNKARKGMAMVSVLFAMTVFMLFGTLIIASALNANASFRLAAKNAEIRNTLSEIGEFFVGQVGQAGDASDTTAEEKCQNLQTVLTERYRGKLSYVYEVTSEASNEQSTFTLRVKTVTGTDEEGNSKYVTNLVVSVCGGKVTRFSYIDIE